MDQGKTARFNCNQFFSWLLAFLFKTKQSPIWFTSLGMVVLDELNFAAESFTDVLGGSGTYGKK